tara:strand:- start:27 stop:638 length:612 start_codon:yes stop_codon:yes gene_type:complete
MIYSIGNSHAHVFTDSHPNQQGVWCRRDNYNSFSLGPIIAYNFKEHHYDRMKRDALPHVDKQSKLFIVVGEVDCRLHLPKQIEESGREMEDVVEECVDRLFKIYLLLKEDGYNIVGWGGHPSTTDGDRRDSPSEPVYGDCLTRNKITKHWDSYLKSLCEKENIEYISIVDDLIDENGLTRMEYFKDYCHLKTELAVPLIESKL